MSYFDGRRVELSIRRALDRKKGGFVTARRNELRDGVADLVGKA